MSAMECNDHGGHGFKSDCWICKAKQTLKDNEGAIERRDKVIAAQAATIEALEKAAQAVVDSVNAWGTTGEMYTIDVDDFETLEALLLQQEEK